jgi:hypothetical protein
MIDEATVNCQAQGYETGWDYLLLALFENTL